MPLGIHWPELIILLMIWGLPLIIGFRYVRPDADSLGQPGIIWALLSIPFSWLAILLYVVVRMLRGAPVAR
jgi:hypothetical protein